MRQKQLSFNKSKKSDFGGSLLTSNPKEQRPLSTKKTIHLVLKSKVAFGQRSLLAPRFVDKVNFIVQSQARLCGVRIYSFVNVGNHIHLIVKITNRTLYKRFIRAVTGLIARLITNKQRSQAKHLSGSAESSTSASKDSASLKMQSDKQSTQKAGFWLARPFTRYVTWGNEYSRVKKYMIKNQKQAQQIQSYFKKVQAQSNLSKNFLLQRPDKLLSNQVLGFNTYEIPS
jgi:REP element-mobilizing transposase RayT